MKAPGLREQVIRFCTRIGANRLLVQGAGGNISWKAGDQLWIKASGTRLADAENEDLFVSVDLAGVREAVRAGVFSENPRNTGDGRLKPSIETLLHVVMPHTVVLHLHAVDVLAHLVRLRAKEEVAALVGQRLRFIYIDYRKPGPDLAKSVVEQLRQVPDADLVFLENHGIVLGAQDVEQLERLLHDVLCVFRLSPRELEAMPTHHDEAGALASFGYSRCMDEELNQLVFDSNLIKRLHDSWALYPDHVVFLGRWPVIAEAVSFRDGCGQLLSEGLPPFVFVLGDGVYRSRAATPSHLAQLYCYFDVVIRQSASDRLKVLTEEEIGQLLNWEAEKYRQRLSANQ